MEENQYNDIQRVYDLKICRGHKEQKKPVQKGIFKKRTIEVIQKVPETLAETRYRITQGILSTLEAVLNKKPQIPGVNERDLQQILNSPPPTLLVSDDQSKRMALLVYDKKVQRMDSAGFGFAYDGEIIALTVFGDAIEKPEQFNALQAKLKE